MKKLITDDDVFELTNKAYDKGGADVLKIELTALEALEIALPEKQKEIAFCRLFIDQMRMKLQAVVQSEPAPETKGPSLTIPDNLIKV